MLSKPNWLLNSIEKSNITQLLLVMIAFNIIVEWFIAELFGIRRGYDSIVYEEYARQLLLGNLPEIHHRWYLSYIFFMSSIFSVGGSIKSVVWAQIILSTLATGCFFLMCHKLMHNKLTAIIATVLLIGWGEIHSWDMYIYTESFFTSMIIISAWALLSNYKTLAIITIQLAIFARPTGVLYLIAIMIFLLSKSSLKISKPKLILATIIAMISMIGMLNMVLTNFTLIKSYYKGEIIFPEISYWISIPADMSIPDPNNSTITQLIQFIVENPLYFAQLSLTKLIFYVGHIKPYYSTLHNLSIIIILYPCYVFAAYGILKQPFTNPEKLFLGSFILLNCIMLMFTSESWDGRFLVPVLPFIFIFSAVGIGSFFKKKLPSNGFFPMLQ